MGRKYKSDFPGRSFNSSCKSGIDFGFNVLLTMIGLTASAYRQYNPKYSSPSCYTSTYRTLGYSHLIPEPKPNIKTFAAEIKKYEQLLNDGSITLNQCERLANIYDTVGDHFNERRARLTALEIFLNESGEGHRIASIVDAFNDPCKQPPETICNNELINEDYRLLLRKAESAKRKSYNFKKLHRL